MISEKNPILNTDSYKASHWLQYPKGATTSFAYIESRGGIYPDVQFVGLQAYIKKYLQRRVTLKDIQEAKEFFTEHGEPFNEAGWRHIVEKHDGALPLRIKAVREGTVVPTHNVLVTVENTDPECYWLPSYIETQLLRAVWYPSTVATISRSIKLAIEPYIKSSCDNFDGMGFKLNDFGSRGVSSTESSEIGGMGHLVNFKGTDNVLACQYIRDYYRTRLMPGFSIPAAEHSTITSWGRNHEADAYSNMLEVYGPRGILAVVSDSYDIFNAVENIWGGILRQKVIDSGAVVVIRPDSGDPVSVVLRVVQILDNKFGHTINSKGFKVLNHVRVIQGDGINEQSIDGILMMLLSHGYSADNVNFGMGGALLQGCNRDTQKWAMKTSAMEVDGVWIDVYKDPITDQGKKSKRGRLMLYKDVLQNKFFTSAIGWDSNNYVAQLHTVYEDGRLLINQTWEDVLATAEEFI